MNIRTLDGGTLPIGTVFCIGRNVFAHAAELGNAAPTEPLVFMKSVGSVRPLDAAGVIAYPEETFHHEAEAVVVVGEHVPLNAKVGWEVVRGVALGLDLTRRAVQDELKKAGLPWILAKSFQGAAPLSPMVPLDRFSDPNAIRFHFDVNGERRQTGDLAGLTFSIPTLLTRLAQIQPLVPGDLVFTGTPAGVADFRVGDAFSLVFSDLGIRFDGVL